MKKSHMDQKVRPYVTKAIEAGYNILEIDVQSACGVIVLGHDWRPKLPFLFDCTLSDYLKRLPSDRKLYLQLDIKEICLTNWGRVRFAKRIDKLLKKYCPINVTCLVSANSGLFRPVTSEYVKFYTDSKFWLVWKMDKTIEVVDLWK